jgi:chemotaxis protein methyltransferase CheR
LPPQRLDLRRRVRVWSAACSTGEEPYSVAMMLLDALSSPALDSRLPSRQEIAIEVVASDLSTRVLEHARQGVYPIEKAAEIPTPYLRAYMRKGKGARAGQMKVGPEIRSLVTFQRLNLIEVSVSRMGRFDLILCRNVLIYFDAGTRTAILEHLLDCLAPGGYLLLGHAESLNALSHRVRCVAPAIYENRPLSAEGMPPPHAQA